MPPSLAMRPPSALLLPSGGVREPVLAVEIVAWLSTVLVCAPKNDNRATNAGQVCSPWKIKVMHLEIGVSSRHKQGRVGHERNLLKYLDAVHKTLNITGG